MSAFRDLPRRARRLPDVRSALTLADRWYAVRKSWRLLLRLAVATSLAYFVAGHLLGHSQPFFAPVSAIIVLVAGAGLRGRLVYELVFGVAVGVLIGELLILVIGRGVWQIALVVVLTVATAKFAGLKGVALTQAANSAVLLTAIVPLAGASNPALTRFLDALVGGFCGLALVLLVPRNAVRDIDIEIQPLLRQLGRVLRHTADALREDDPARADAALAEARGMQPMVQAAQNTAANVSEIARMSPMRWRQRERVDQYVTVLTDLDNAIRDARVLARRVASMLRHGEEAPTDMRLAVEALAKAVGIFADDLAEQEDFAEARQALVDAARIAVLALPAALTLNLAAIAAQVRSLAADLLLASGMTRDELDERLDFD